MNRQQQIDFGRKLRDEGIERAVDHAERKVDSWKDTAYRYFKIYLEHKPRGFRFMIEDFRVHVRDVLPEPPSKRAFGVISVMAKRDKLIVRDGYRQVKNPTAHRANAAIWRKL